MIRDTSVTCCVCKTGEQGHDSASGACFAFRRAQHPPLEYRVARVPTAAKGWRWR